MSDRSDYRISVLFCRPRKFGKELRKAVVEFLDGAPACLRLRCLEITVFEDAGGGPAIALPTIPGALPGSRHAVVVVDSPPDAAALTAAITAALRRDCPELFTGPSP